MKTKILCFCSKSGVGKSSCIDIMKQYDKCKSVISNTTRLPRDEFDKTTHVFKSFEDYLQDKENGIILSEYHSPKGYINWVSKDNFDTDKINLFAVDARNALELMEHTDYEVTIVYLYCDEITRGGRLLDRNSNILNYGLEEHLNILRFEDKLFKYIDDIKLIDTTNKTVEQVVDTIISKTNLLVQTYELYTVGDKYFVVLMNKTIVLEDVNNHEQNLKILLDNILQDYIDLGFAKFEDYEEIYIEYKNRLLRFVNSSEIKDFHYYRLLVETLLKWKGGSY